MAGYKPIKVTGYATGLVQEREEFLLPNDAYPTLENAFVWRERIKRKQGVRLLGRLRRLLTGQALGNTVAGVFTGNIISILSLESNADIEIGSVTITVGAQTFTDPLGNGTLTNGGLGTGTINYATGALNFTTSPNLGGTPVTITFNYFPRLPVMGLRSRELSGINNEQLVAFDQTYAYKFGATGFQEFIPGTTWTGTDSDFFWSTNYWVSASNTKIFWVTNFSGTAGDPIRYTDSSVWVNFAPQINAAGDVLAQCLALLPFRGRLIAFNTFEGPNLAGSVQFRQRIRWAAIGNPFTTLSPIVTSINVDAWRDDIRGQGGFLDIPTAEDIVSVGFVRDNLVIYCERSTWQLRYTGRSIAPFQIEKVNTELGAESTFSAVQFDTSLVGIGDKGVVECDSYKSERIDIKIPDLVFQFNNDADGVKRVHGIRDIPQRLAYWTYPYRPWGNTYPDHRLVYNYENDSWAIFTDSFTCFGTYQPQTSGRWVDYSEPIIDQWKNQNWPWISKPALFPAIVAGNQQGYVEFVGSQIMDSPIENDVSLTIQNITGNTTTATTLTSSAHNLITGQIILINGIPTGNSFANLNNGVFMVVRTSSSTLDLYKYDSTTLQFSEPQKDPSGTYLGGGKISVKDNFRIVSKKFNSIDEGQQLQLGYIDVLMDDTDDGAISLYVYQNYNDTTPINILPENINPSTAQPDAFFNTTVPTNSTDLGTIEGTKNWQRVFCPTRGQFITIEWTLSNAQMAGVEQANDVQIDAQIIWARSAGRLV